MISFVFDISPDPTEAERAAIEAALAEDPEDLPPPGWLAETSHEEP